MLQLPEVSQKPGSLGIRRKFKPYGLDPALEKPKRIREMPRNAAVKPALSRQFRRPHQEGVNGTRGLPALTDGPDHQ